MRVILTADARARIESEIRASGRVETGGALLGWRRPDLDIVVIADATGPGPKASRSRHRLEVDTDDLQRHIDAAFAATNGDHSFLGDWHLHHEATPHPSSQDLASLNELTAESGVAMQDAVLVIVGRSRNGGLKWRAWSAAASTEAEVVFHTD
jgi:integrative and conjugative element protein (TIGR02256 family)